MSTSTLLRNKTADLHQAAELALNVVDIRQSSLSFASYTRMMLAHYQVWTAILRWLPVTADSRHRYFVNAMQGALKADLEVLKVEFPAAIDFTLEDQGEASLYGVLYVLRGSTLGGTMIDRKLRDCPELSRLGSFNFHGACSALAPRHWPDFVKELDDNTSDKGDRLRSLKAARAVFGMYLTD